MKFGCIFSFLIPCIFFISCSNQPKIKLPPDSVAYGDINFGIKKPDFLKKYKDSTVILDNSIYHFSPFFIPDDHRLYMLQMISESRHTNDIASFVTEDMNTLVTKMIGIYGTPIYLKMFDIKQLDPNKVSWYCRWIFKNKLIWIGIGRLKDDNTYYRDNRNYAAICEITDIPLQTIANKQLIYLEF